MSTCEHDRQDDVCWECRDQQIATLERDLATLTEAVGFHPTMSCCKDAATHGRHIVADLAAAKENIAALLEEDRVWEKHSLVQIVAERRELRARVTALESNLARALGCNAKYQKENLDLLDQVAALTEALVSEYLAGVEWGIKNMCVRADWPLSWDAGWPGFKAQALLDRAALAPAKETM